tara:strand:+ start:155 stop:964 length:810 start_codon:yes stop_codon:yes gene_type:complete
MSSSNLYNLFYSSKKRSIKWKKYFSVYEKLFTTYKNKKITFVEIGVLDGGSLEVWKNYFGKDARIIGIDNNPECKKFENENYEIFIGSQSNPLFWREFYNKVGNVDIILDDGGHTNDQQIISLIESVKFINNGGLHVVEDVHSSYQKHYGNPYKYSFINFSKKTIDDVNSTFPNIKKFNYSLNQFVSSIEFFESIVAFKINRNLTFENILVENNGLKSKNEDMTIDKSFINFRNKFSFLYRFKFFRKIERILIKIFYRKQSKKLKYFFK